MSAGQSWAQGSGASSSPYLRVLGVEGRGILHQGQVVTAAQVSAQEKWGATAAQRAVRYHGHTISQELRLIQVVGGEDERAIWT